MSVNEVAETETEATAETVAEATTETETTGSDEAANEQRRFRRLARPGLAVAVLIIVVTGGVAIWSHDREQAVHTTPAARNAALTDVATTAAVKNQVTQAVQTLFSFDYSNPDKTASAVSGYLTGKAVNQYAALMAPVRSHAADLKLELTTTVTSAGVQTMQGDRARVLVFVDQNDTSSATAGTSESSVAFAVDAQRVGGTWKIAGIDTLGA